MFRFVTPAIIIFALAGPARAAPTDIVANTIASTAEAAIVANYPLEQMKPALRAASLGLLRCGYVSGIMSGLLVKDEKKKEEWAIRAIVFSKAAGALYPYDEPSFKRDASQQESAVRERDVEETQLLLTNCVLLGKPTTAKSAVDAFVAEERQRQP